MNGNRLEGVSKTAILTLRCRSEEAERPDARFRDPLASAWLEQMEWPAELDDWYTPLVGGLVATRAHELDLITLEMIEEEAVSTVVELGAGLSTRRDRLGEPAARVHWIDLDLPEVIAIRERLGAPADESIAASVLDESWFDRINSEPESTLFLAEGLLYYLPREDVDDLFSSMRQRFPRALVSFDVIGSTDFVAGLKNSSAVGAPMQWSVDPFEAIFPELGIEIVPRWEPKRAMERALSLYGPRFGRGATPLLKVLSKVSWLAQTRSGTVSGRLAALTPRSN